MNNYRCTFKDYWGTYTYQTIVKAKTKGDVWKKYSYEGSVDFVDKLIRVNKISDKMLEIFKWKIRVAEMKEKKRKATEYALAKLKSLTIK
jgi:hypothetical protein